MFNNKDILVDGKPIFLSEWFRKGIVSINELLNETGNVLTFQEFRDKYSCESNFLQYYHVVSAIPNRLCFLAKCSDTINRSFFTQNDDIFSLNESTQINLCKAKSKDFYNLFNVKIHTEDQTGPKRCSEKLSLNKDVWTRIFKSLKNICKETKLKEFQFKLIHRTIVTKKELFRFGIKRTMNVYTAEIKIQLSTLLSNMRLPNCLPKMFWTGLTKLISVKFLLLQKRSCSVSL